MDYRKLAEEFMEMRTSMPRTRITRDVDDYSRGELMALNYIAASRELVHPKDLSKALMLTTARVAAMLGSMEKKGLIKRLADDSDSRQIVVTITEEGRRLVAIQKERMLERMTAMLEYLGEEDAEAYVRIHRKLMRSSLFWM
ncbi:MarR family winged helix-turn-helix transcriptional regulator [Butyrivibrio sp. MC2013]|uniref:MarR family winged helix-turn-helix transcriptional regulator n=1 Tax=Butyrivibrio sp. MC2013 TaxID=1280686 RepID=UPI0004100882|nr:MarR family transcriptional regulator [Butyrivibrio sp. MC2013]